MKIKILVCDDSQIFVDEFVVQVQKCLRSICQAEICGVTDPSQLEDQDLKEYDIVFLDIDMGAHNGVALAKHMRTLNSKSILIFVTNYIEYSPEGYEVQAFRFLLKGQIQEKLAIYLSDAIQELQRHAHTLQYALNGEPLQVDIQNLSYLESEGRKIHPHTCHGNPDGPCFYGTLDQLEKQLRPAGFMRVHKSFLVNITYVESFRYNQVRMKDGVVLPVSERRYASLRKQYLDWKLYQK